MLERGHPIPPANLEAEKCVLGSILLDPTCLLRISVVLMAKDFYLEAHRHIYGAMLDLMHARTPIDLLTVTNKLEETKLVEAVGGKGAIAELTEFVPTASHADEYAEIVGGKAYQRRLIEFGNDVQTLAFKPDADPTEVRERAETLLLEMGRSRRRSSMMTLGEVLNETYTKIAEAEDATDPNARFIFTGFTDLDMKLGGMEKSDMVVIAARPGMGKTAIALTIARNVANAKKRVGIFSLEMSRQQIARRLLASESGVDGWKLRANRYEKGEQERVTDAIGAIHELPILIFDTSGVSLMELRSHARRAQMEGGLDLLIIDYLQLMSGRGGDNRATEVSEISRGVKALARELDIPIIALSQLNRAVEGRDSKIPNLSDLKESGSIEQDANMVLMLYRDDYYNEQSLQPGVVEVHIKKNRDGATGKVGLRFDRSTTTFRDILPPPQQLRMAA